MKKVILILFLFIVNNKMQAQEKFNYNSEGLTLTPYVVVKIDSAKQNELYQKTINWIKENYVNPDVVIKTSIQDNMIRIEGVQENALYRSLLGKVYHDAKYTIKISFKEGRYKFEPLSLESGYHKNFGWLPVKFDTGQDYFRKNGTLRNEYKMYPLLISKLFNDLNNSLKEYLSSKKKNTTKEEDDW